MKKQKKQFIQRDQHFKCTCSMPKRMGISNRRFNDNKQLAVETCYWPLYENREWKYKINYKPAKKLPVEEF